jgi:hypothetical protein
LQKKLVHRSFSVVLRPYVRAQPVSTPRQPLCPFYRHKAN